MFTQLFLEFSDLSPCCKCHKIVAVSEYADVFDKTSVHTRVEHPNVVIARSQCRSKHCAACLVPYIAQLSMAIPDGHDGSLALESPLLMRTDE